MKLAEMASKIIPTGYDILNAMLIQDRCLDPIFSVTDFYDKLTLVEWYISQIIICLNILNEIYIKRMLDKIIPTMSFPKELCQLRTANTMVKS